MATLDVLGESIRSPDEAEATATEYERALDAIAAEQLDANVSVKLSALGLEIDGDLVDRTSRACSPRPSGTGSSCASTWSTRPHRRDARDLPRLRAAGHDGIGVVLQAYMRRTLADDRRAGRPAAERAPRSRASTSSRPVAFQRCPRSTRTTCARSSSSWTRGGYVGIATHDRALSRRAGPDRPARAGRDRYEFQMLLGVPASSAGG